MALGGPGNGPSEATALMAYKLHSEDRLSYRQIAAEMAGPPHFCGNHTTARRWVEAGRRLIHYDEDGMSDPLRKRGARREVASDTLDALFVKIEADMVAGHLPRADGRRLQLRMLENYVHLHGLRRAPEPARVKVSGAKGATTPRDLFESLAAIPPDELDALIDDMLPNGRTDR